VERAVRRPRKPFASATSISSDPATGDFGDAKIIRRFEPFCIPALPMRRGIAAVDYKARRAALETRRVGIERMIAKYREFARAAPNDRTKQRIEGQIAEFEKQLREPDCS